MTLIEVRELSKDYLMGEVTVQALRDVSLKIEVGEFIVILGQSGSGKSTLLNIIGGMDTPTSGEIFYQGRSLVGMKERELTEYRREHVGFVFQFFALMSYLTAKENVELATEIASNPLSVEQVLVDVGLADRTEHFPAQLSGGEQQRVAIARAIAKNAELLLCDEPTGALDSATGVEVLRALKEVHEKYNKTIIIITHNATIAEIADRVIRLSNGQIIEDYTNKNPISVDGIEW